VYIRPIPLRPLRTVSYARNLPASADLSVAIVLCCLIFQFYFRVQIDFCVLFIATCDQRALASLQRKVEFKFKIRRAFKQRCNVICKVRCVCDIFWQNVYSLKMNFVSGGKQQNNDL